MSSTLTSTPVRQVPYVDIAGQHVAIKEELLEAIDTVITRGQFILGEEVERFERDFAKLCGVRFAVGLNSGTDALVLALRALGVGDGEGDEVITAPNSFVASAGSIGLAGARPVFVDVGEDYNIDPGRIAEAITPSTKAIMPVHLTGRPAAMDEIVEIASECGLLVVEDCAQAVMAEYRGRRAGSLGHVGCFSFHPLKTLNACGDGGVVTTNDEELYEKLRVMRNLGLRTRDECVTWSTNSRLDTLQAAVLLVKLKYLERWTAKRRANAAFYQAELGSLEEVVVPVDALHERAVYHTFVIQAERRDELRAHLKRRGVGTAVHYPVPIHLQPAAAELGNPPGSFPVTEHQVTRVVSLPVYPELQSSQLEQVVGAVHEFYRA